jgi:hypothetical protein
MDEAAAAAWRAEARSKVAFDIEDVGHGAAKLTVTHDGFAPGSAVRPAHGAAHLPGQPLLAHQRNFRRNGSCGS